VSLYSDSQIPPVPEHQPGCFSQAFSVAALGSAALGLTMVFLAHKDPLAAKTVYDTLVTHDISPDIIPLTNLAVMLFSTGNYAWRVIRGEQPDGVENAKYFSNLVMNAFAMALLFNVLDKIQGP
jgi:hypothetical protein